MSNHIETDSGRVVGEWDGRDVRELIQVLVDIKRQLKLEGTRENVTRKGIPHQHQCPEDLHTFSGYIIWACDRSGDCLVGSAADRTESVARIRKSYANQIAQDAPDRHA